METQTHAAIPILLRLKFLGPRIVALYETYQSLDSD